MKILVRLPNWLGDMVMSIPFVENLHKQYPHATISVIVKKGLEPLLHYFPSIDEKFIFSKTNHPGLSGVFKFGKNISRQTKFDLFFSLPDSFSSAVMGWAGGASQRVGYSNEGRSILLTKSFKKNREIHRVLQYVDLLQQFTGKQLITTNLKLSNLPALSKREYILVNIHSEAISRRIPKQKAVSIISHLREKVTKPIIMIGGPNDIGYASEVIEALPNRDGIINKTGSTSVNELPLLMNDAAAMLSSDSGPSHLANAIGVPLIVLFGAGDEKSTAPFNEHNRTIIRLGQLSCEPCVKNTCIYGLPKCLELLDENRITDAVLNYLK
jgi:lipopolysaccharide heptosyltransferase II